MIPHESRALATQGEEGASDHAHAMAVSRDAAAMARVGEEIARDGDVIAAVMRCRMAPRTLAQRRAA